MCSKTRGKFRPQEYSISNVFRCRVIEDVFEKLILWAAAALEKSSNQPVLPHAVIVLNAEKNDIDFELWDINVATEKVLQSLSETVVQNSTFKKYTLFWRERSRTIKTVEELLLSYYSSIRVVRIPTIGRPNLINEQIVKLYNTVRTACKSAQETRRSLRMLLDADELQPYLQVAFDHFACNLDTAFDFVQASFANSPIPSDFGGNILKLAISFMEAFPDVDGPAIFKELSTMVASCIMLDSARHRIRGTLNASLTMTSLMWNIRKRPTDLPSVPRAHRSCSRKLL